MAKRAFVNPFIISFSGLEDGGDVIVIGGGTGQSTTDPHPCSFADWQIMFADNFYFEGEDDETIDFNDYVAWWYEMGFTSADYQEINGSPLPPNPWGD